MKQTRLRLGVGLAASVAAAALALSGCGESSDGSSAGGTTLTVWHYANTDGQVEGLKKLAASFLAAHPDVKVDFQYVPVEQMTTKAVTAAGSKTGPDVLVFG